jgi:hypothetical protein
MQLVENQTIMVQENSFLKEFKLAGAKSQALTIYNDAAFKKVTNYGTHLQNDTLEEYYPAMLQSGPIAYNDRVRIKRLSDNAVTLDMSIPPGGIPADFWNRKLSDVGLGEYTFESTEVNTEIVNFPMTLEQNNRIFGQWLMANGTTMRIFDGTYKFLDVSFRLNGMDFDGREAAALGQLESAITEFNTQDNPLHSGVIFIYLSDGNLSITSTNVLDLRIEIFYDPVVIGAGGAAQTFTFTGEKLTYLSKEIPTAGVPFKFVTTYAGNFYDGKGESFTGYINAKAGEILRLNNYLERNAYPLVPSFSFKYIIGVLLEKYGYTIDDENWQASEDEYFCAMVDMAEQIAGTDLPFNIYPEKILYNDYVPDVTVREFFESFLLLIGCAPMFDSSAKTFLLKPFPKTLTEEPILVEAAQEMGVDFESTKSFGYSYKDVLESETTTDTLKGFFALQNAENITPIEQIFLPLAPKQANDDRRRTAAPRAGGTWIGTDDIETDNIITFAETKGKSVMFGLAEAAIPRVFTLKNNQADSSAYGLNATDGFYVKNILPMLDVRTGKILNLESYLTKHQVSQLSTLRKIHYKGVEWLLNQFDVAISTSNYCVVKMELERIK